MTKHIQEWCRYPSRALDSCQEWCKCPAGAPASVRSGAEIDLLGLRVSVSQTLSLGDFLLALASSIEKVTLWEGFRGIRNWRGCCKRQKLLPKLGIGPRIPGPVRYPLSYRFTLICIQLIWHAYDDACFLNSTFSRRRSTGLWVK